MKKLMTAVIAGSICAAFSVAHAQSNPGATLQSDKGVKTPKLTDDNRMDLRPKGATDAKGAAGSGSSAAASSSATTTAAPAPAPAADAPAKKSRRAARREKG